MKFVPVDLCTILSNLQGRFIKHQLLRESANIGGRFVLGISDPMGSSENTIIWRLTTTNFKQKATIDFSLYWLVFVTQLLLSHSSIF